MRQSCTRGSSGPLVTVHRAAASTIEALERRTLLAAVFFTAQGDGTSWTDPRNWSSGALPQPADNVTINIADRRTITLVSGAQSIHSLTNNNPLQVSGGSLAVATSVQTSQDISVAGGTLVGGTYGGQGRIVASTGTLDHVIANLNILDTNAPGAAPLQVVNGLTVNALFTVGNATFNVLPGTVDFSGSQTLGGSGQVQLVDGPSSQIAVIGAAAPATLTLAPGITVHGQGVLTSGSGDTLINQGSISADVAQQTLSITAANFVNQGTLKEVNGGILSINPAGGNGSVQFTGGASVINGPFNVASLSISGGQVTINSTSPVFIKTLVLSGGTLDGTAAINLTGTTSAWTGGSIAGTGTMTVQQGAVLSASTGGTLTCTRPFNVAGTLKLAAGTLELDGNGTHAGTFLLLGTLVIGDGAQQDMLSTSAVVGTGTFQLKNTASALIQGTYSLTDTVVNDQAALTFEGSTSTTETLHVNGGTVTVGVPKFPAVARAVMPAQAPPDSLEVVLKSVIAGSVVVMPGWQLVDDGDLLFTGTAGPSVALESDVATPGQMQVGGNVFFSGGLGTAQIRSDGSAALAGQVLLNGATPEFLVGPSLTLVVSAPINGASAHLDDGGVLELSGANTFGGVVVGNGELQVDSPAALGPGPAVTFTGGTLVVHTASPISNTLFAAATDGISLDVEVPTAQIRAITAGAALNVTGIGSLSLSGGLTLQHDLVIHNSTDVTISGAISGPFGLAEAGPANLTFASPPAPSPSNTNTYAGLTQVFGGTLLLDKRGTVAVPGDLSIVGPGTARLMGPAQLAATSNVRFDATVGPATLDLNGNAQTLASVQIGPGATPPNPQNDVLNVGAGALTLGHTVANSIGTLSINTAGGGQVNLGAGSLSIIYGASPDPVATIRSYLVSGYAGGSWNGPGLMTSAGLALGYADGADGVVAGLAASSILVKYARPGDANLDGQVNFTDLVNLARHFGKTNAGWDHGDFDYDGTVTFTDFVALARNYGKSAAVAAVFASSAQRPRAGASRPRSSR